MSHNFTCVNAILDDAANKTVEVKNIWTDTKPKVAHLYNSVDQCTGNQKQHEE